MEAMLNNLASRRKSASTLHGCTEERNRIRDGVRQQIHWTIWRERPGASYRELPRRPPEHGGWGLQRLPQQPEQEQQPNQIDDLEADEANENEGQGGVPDQPMNLVEGSQEIDSAASSESDPEFTVRRIEPWEPDPVQLTALEFEPRSEQGRT